MNENEQSGMLRNVIVVGLIAIIGLAIIFSVIGLKSKMTYNSTKANGVIAMTKVPYGVTTPNVSYQQYTPNPSANSGWGDHITYFPVVGDIPNNSWREVRMLINSSANAYVRIDVNNNPAKIGRSNDNDDMSKRSLQVYDQSGKQIVSTNSMYYKVHLNKNKDYTFIVKYFNNSGKTFVENKNDYSNRMSGIISGTDTGEAYKLNIKVFEAATYDDVYTK